MFVPYHAYEASAGSGKTFSALLIAGGLGGRVALVDTENGSGDMYGNEFTYDICTLPPPYTVARYLEALRVAERAGYDVIILDSITHAWAGEGGLLEQVDKHASGGRDNRFTAWPTTRAAGTSNTLPCDANPSTVKHTTSPTIALTSLF